MAVLARLLNLLFILSPLSIVWLYYLGELRIIAWGLGLAIAGPVISGFLLLATASVARVAGRIVPNRAKVTAVGFTRDEVLFLAQTTLATGAWCVAVFAFLTQMASLEARLPAALASYGVAAAPFVRGLAREEREGRSGGRQSLVWLQVAHIWMAVAFVSDPTPTIADAAATFLGARLIGMYVEFRRQRLAARAFVNATADPPRSPRNPPVTSPRAPEPPRYSP